MSNESPIPAPPTNAIRLVEPARPCAFYITEMVAAPRPENAAPPGRSAMRHRCLLNPGRAYGPDGNGISVGECSPERQALCQSHRRADLARLNATCPTRAAAA